MAQTVRVLVIRNEAEAALLKSLLEAERIPYVLKSFSDTAYDGLYQMQKGWGAIQAPAEFADRIRELYEGMQG